MKKICIIVPTYNEEASLPEMYRQLCGLTEEQKNYEWTFLFVDDGSGDGTARVLEDLRAGDVRVTYVQLSRNFGKENAMLAGFDYAEADAVVVMDCDLQHPVSVVPRMLREYEAGYEDVYARRRDRGHEPPVRRFLTNVYYRLLQKSTRMDVLPDAGDFRLLDRRCVRALCQLRERQRYTKGLYCWIGFRKKEIFFDPADRLSGRSSFSMAALLNLAIDGITSFTTAPLRISAVVGGVVSVAAFLYLCFIVGKTLVVGEPVQGFPTLITVILFLGGIQLLSIGIIGEYIARIFNETKRRPVYIVDKVNGKNV